MTVKQQCLNIIAKTGDLYLGQTRGVIEDLFHKIETEVEESPIVHGEWISLGADYNDINIYKCSVCGVKKYGRDTYCGRCGAKMDGGK